MERINMYLQCSLVILISGYSVSSTTTGYYTAAVFEHARRGDEFPNTTVQTNLHWYKRVTELAKEQGADLIVFPEYGIFPPGERTEIKKRLELIPNPKDVKVNPCNESELYSDRPILYFLSCIAKQNAIVVVANMGGLERCVNQSDCPEDGDLHMNANVAFDADGTLLGRYYKERLFNEPGMDSPLEEQDPTFETNFGKFAMFICFDILFQKMATTSQQPDIDAILFPTMWVTSFPFFMSISWFQAWAMGNNATLLAANLHMPGHLAVGSGIFRGADGAIASTFNPDGVSRLLVAAIPKQYQIDVPVPRITSITENSTKLWQKEDDGKDVSSTCSYSILGTPENAFKDFRCANEDISNYTLKKLHRASDHIEVCSSDICCELNYTANSMNESFYLGVYGGLHNSFNMYFWSEENCFLARCDDFNGTVCSNFPTQSETLFIKVSMTANFKSENIYPSLVNSRMRLVPTNMWTYKIRNNKPFIHFNNSSGIQLLVASLKTRVYDKDPPHAK